MKPSEVCRNFLVEAAQKGSKGLDVGCGDGSLILAIHAQGASCVGVEIDPDIVRKLSTQGLNVQLAFAERLPFADESFDFIVASVVLPYTEPRQALFEFARVLKPGATLRLTTHSIEYGVGYLLSERGILRKIYGFRMLINTWFYRVTAKRLPGFLGDTLCFSNEMLINYSQQAGFKEIGVERCGQSGLGRRFTCFKASR
jgi:ubiquinone/menaquinone biosynthesis C-methylase UbiE